MLLKSTTGIHTVWNIKFNFVFRVCFFICTYACFVSLMNGIEFKTSRLEHDGPIIISSTLVKRVETQQQHHHQRSNLSSTVKCKKWKASGFEQLEGSFEGGTSPVIQSKTWHSLTEPRPCCVSFHCTMQRVFDGGMGKVLKKVPNSHRNLITSIHYPHSEWWSR